MRRVSLTARIIAVVLFAVLAVGAVWIGLEQHALDGEIWRRRAVHDSLEAAMPAVMEDVAPTRADTLALIDKRRNQARLAFAHAVEQMGRDSVVACFAYDIDRDSVPEMWLRLRAGEWGERLVVLRTDTLGQAVTVGDFIIDTSSFSIGDNMVVSTRRDSLTETWTKYTFNGVFIVQSTVYEGDIVDGRGKKMQRYKGVPVTWHAISR